MAIEEKTRHQYTCGHTTVSPQSNDNDWVDGEKYGVCEQCYINYGKEAHKFIRENHETEKEKDLIISDALKMIEKLQKENEELKNQLIISKKTTESQEKEFQILSNIIEFDQKEVDGYREIRNERELFNKNGYIIHYNMSVLPSDMTWIDIEYLMKQENKVYWNGSAGFDEPCLIFDGGHKNQHLLELICIDVSSENKEGNKIRVYGED